jgi:hypothetical protein
MQYINVRKNSKTQSDLLNWKILNHHSRSELTTFPQTLENLCQGSHMIQTNLKDPSTFSK